MIYFITQQDDPQINLFCKLARKNDIPFEVIDFSNPGLKISFSSGEILINNKIPEEKSLFYFHNIEYEFPHIPEAPVNNDWTIFQDFHAAQQQQKSHIYSLLSLLSGNRKFKVVNDFHLLQKFAVKSYMLKLLSDDGLDVPDFILTNSYNRLKDSSLFIEKDHILWSYPEPCSPVRRVNKKRLIELIKTENPVPFIFFEEKIGYPARVIFYEKYPVLITLIDKPIDEMYEEKLEKFHYIKPHKSLQELGRRLLNLFGLKLYEIHGVIDDEEKFWFYDVSSKLNISSYSPKVQKFILAKLLEHFTATTGNKVSIDVSFEESEYRKTLFLKRMLNPLFEIQRKTEL